MRLKRCVLAILSASLLTGCEAPTYIGWGLTSKLDHYRETLGTCTQRASDGTFKHGSEWSQCIVEASTEFSNEIGLSRADILVNFSTQIRRLGGDLEAKRITGHDFYAASQLGEDRFWQNIQQANIDQQNGINHQFVDLEEGLLLAAAGASQAAVLAPVASVAKAPSASAPVAFPVNSAPKPNSIGSKTTIESCTGLIVGALITANCRSD